MPGNTAVRNPDAYLLQMAVNVATDQYVDRLRQARPWHYADGAEAVLEQLADGAAGPATLAEVRSELAARHGISLRRADGADRHWRHRYGAPGFAHGADWFPAGTAIVCCCHISIMARQPSTACAGRRHPCPAADV